MNRAVSCETIEAMQVLGKLSALVCALALLLAPAPTHANPPANPPAPHIDDDSLTLAGTNVWAGLKGSRVNLTLHDGAQLSGTLVTQNAQQLALARDPDGMLVSVAKREIQGCT